MSVLRAEHPDRIETIETVADYEQRAIFAVAAVGRAIIYTNTEYSREEIIEIVLESAGANTIQLLAQGVPLTPPFPMIANQTYIDAGFFLALYGIIELITGAANAVVGFVRWRRAGARA